MRPPAVRGLEEPTRRPRVEDPRVEEVTVAALDALPAPKRLIAEELKSATGEVCAMGSVGLMRGLDMAKVDYEEPQEVGKFFGITRMMAAEIAYVNDEGPFYWRHGNEGPEARYERVSKWVNENLLPPAISSPQEQP